ncbi:FHA domain-containing protein [Arthrobacter sp. MDT1-65]
MSEPIYGNEFVVVNGDALGTRIVIPHGKATIGSEEGAGIRLAAPGVSRSHAEVTSLDGRTILADRASRNGSWVNGRPVTSPMELAGGDLVQFGEVRLRFLARNADGEFKPSGQFSAGYTSGGQGSAGSSKRSVRGGEGGGQKPALPTVRPKERLGTTLLFATGINLIGLLGNTLTTFLTQLTPTWAWFVTPVVTLVVALVTETMGYYRKGGNLQPTSRQDHPHRPPAPRRPLAVTLLVTSLLLGGGGWLVTAAVSNAVGYFSGNEDGVQRLESQVVTEVQGVKVTVLGVKSTPHYTRVEIRVDNGTSSPIALHLFHNTTLTAPDGTTFEADPSRSSWQPEIPPAGVRKGTINFENQLPQSATTVSLNFIHVFVMGFDGPGSITVPDIPLKSLAASPTGSTSNHR